MTHDGYTTFRTDTIITGTLIKICNGIGKKTDSNRLVNIFTILTEQKDSVYIARPQTFNIEMGKPGEMVTYKVGPWLNNYYVSNNCRLNKDKLIVTIRK